MARPSEYSPEIVSLLCERLAEGISLRTVCLADDMPSKATVFNWLRKHPEFVDQYTRAKEESAYAHFEDMMDIADDGTNDWMEAHDKDGESRGWRENGEAIQRSRLRVETRKWALSKLLPKKFGEKVQTEHSGVLEISAVERQIVRPS